MARILLISSAVARGQVGLNAMAPVLTSRGHDVIALPTIVLSNHPGYPHAAAAAIAPRSLDAMIDAIGANGWLSEVAVIVTGYLPSAAHAAFALRTVHRVKAENRSAHYLCDPIVGDLPKGLYVPLAAAEAIKSELIPLSDTLTPNAFELGWLTGLPIESLERGAVAARRLGRPNVIATSIPTSPGTIASCLWTDGATWTVQQRVLPKVGHGTGDLLAGLVAGALAEGLDISEGFLMATDALAKVVEASSGRDGLDLRPAVEAQMRARP